MPGRGAAGGGLLPEHRGVKPPEFTVLIALYNKEAFIRRTLESALSQQHAAKEILIVDDGSTDGSVERIADLIGGPVRLVRQANAGPGPARNRGFAEAACEWVALLDADDLWLPDHLSTLAELVVQFPEAEVVNTAFDRVRAGELTELVPRNDMAVQGGLSNYFTKAGTNEGIWSSSVAIRKNAFAATGGFGPFWPGEDLELWARLALDRVLAASSKVTALYSYETGGLMEQESGTRFGPGEEPEHRLLSEALADPRYADKHADISSYLNRSFKLRVRQALYAADPGRARVFLGMIGAEERGGLAAYRVLSRLPAWALRAGMRGYRRIRRLRPG
jgi:glycosyltransferase involved in cell wall biosynthesis